MKVTVEGGRAVRVEGDPTHPVTRGFLCVKVNHYLERTYAQDRLLRPQQRVGTKGEGRFREITWHQALTIISDRFKEICTQYGPEAILPYSYSGTLGLLNSGSMDRRFFNRLGASQLGRTICSKAGYEGYKYSLGAARGTDPEAFAQSRLIICWGTNPVTSGVHLTPFIKKAKEKGATLVVIDPRRTRTARLADLHLQPYPGSDAALALGMMHVLINDGLYDKDYVAGHTLGFARLRARVQEYPLERVAQITGIAPEGIRELATLYATLKPCVIRLNYGLQRHTNGGMVTRTIALLPALVGAWRDIAGGILLSTSEAFPLNHEALYRNDLRQGNPRTINMIKLGEALLEADDPPLKALFIYGADPANSTPHQSRVLKGLSRDDLFTVVHDSFLTDTAAYADILLPATTQLEQLDIHTAYGNYYLQINQPAIAPLGESKPNTELFRLLARYMGFDEACFEDSDEEMIDQLLDDDHPALRGITRERLYREGWAKLNSSGDLYQPFPDGHFPTPSGKVEFYSERMAEDGFDPLPAHIPLAESWEGSPELHEKYPISLISPSAHHFLNASFGNVPTLVRKEGQPVIELNPQDAAARGIANGDLVRVWNDRGQCLLYARVGDTVRPGVAASPSVWWSSKMPGGRGINQLTSDREADMGGGATFYTNLVQVARACPPNP